MSRVQISQNTSTMPSIKIIHEVLKTYCSCSTAKSCSTSAGRSDLRKSSFRSSFWASAHRERILRRICTWFAVVSYCLHVADMEANANTNKYYPISVIDPKKCAIYDKAHTTGFSIWLHILQENDCHWPTIAITTHLKYDSKMNIH